MSEVMGSLSTYGYIILFLYSLGGGYVAIIAAGILSHLGEMNIIVSIIIATLANFTGDTLLFYMGRYNKQEMHSYLQKHRRKLALAHIKIKQYGDAIIIIQKYIYGIKTLVPLAIGLTRYDFKRFSSINAFASIVWGVSVGLSAYYAGSFLVPVVEYLGDHFYFVLLFLAVTVALLAWYFKSATKKKVRN